MADNVRALVIKSGTTQNIPAADSLLVGSGIDASSGSGALVIGGATATSITIGSGSITTDFPGPVQLTGDVTTVGGTTFTSDATFEGNVTFGNGPSDTVTFASTTTIINDIAFNGAGFRVTNMLDPSSAQDGATKAYADTKLALTGGTMSGPIAMGSNLITGLTPGVAGTDAANVDQVNAIAAIEYDQQIFVAAGADPLVATGAPLRPFASISAAMAAITDAAPTKRYAISVAAGTYTEASALDLKPNVFIIGVSRDAVRITAPSFGLDASFTGGADNRSGISNAIVTGTASFNFTTVTSAAGKLYFRDTSFNSALTLTGYNNATVQAQLSGCQMFAVFTLKGINVGVFNDNILFSNIVLNQGDFGGCPTLLSAAGGAAGDLTVTTTVNDFTRRCSVFTHSLKFDGTVTVDGPSSYLDYTVGSLPAAGATVLNGGNLVSADFGANKTLSNLAFPTAVNNPIMPATTNALNFGDWGKQWFWNFGYLHASTGTDCYLASYPSAFGAEATAGKNVYAIADAAGLAANINGGGVGLFSSNATGTGNSGSIEAETGTAVNGNSGSVTLTTGAVSGTGTRGIISLDGREIDANSTKIVNLADGVDPTDAVNKSQLDALVVGVSDVTATAPLLSSGGATPDISIDTAGAANGDVLTFNAGAWAAAAPVLTPPGGAVDNVQLNDGAGGFAGSASLSFSASTLTVQSTVAVTDGSETLSLTKDSASTDAATLDIEAASSVTATITGGASFLLTPNSIDALTYAASVAINLDPSLPPLKSVALTGDITFTTSNVAAARNVSVRVIGDTVSRNLVFPAGWTWLGGAAPTVLEANKVAIMSIAAFGATDSTIVASWSYDGSDVVTDVTATGPLASSGGATPDISLTGIVPVANGGTGTSTAFTQGSVVFAGASGVYAQDNASLFFDDGTNSLGIRTATPNEALTVSGAISVGEGSAPSATAAFGKLWANSAADARPYWTDDTGQSFNLTLDRFNTLAPAASVAIDTSPALPVFNSLALNQNTTFTTSNLGNGRSASVRVIGDASTRTLTWPAGWTWLGSGVPPADLAAGDVGYLSITAYGATDADVVAAWSYENQPAPVTDVTASAPLASSGGATPDISLTGVIDVANGGTGVATITAGSLVVGDGANAVNEIAPGSNGEVLTVVAGAWTSQALPAAVDYSVVSITTAVSQGDAVTVAGAAAIATAAASARVAGMVSATANKVSVLGIIEDCNFEGSLTLAVGEAVYLSASSAGKLTNVAPSASGEVVAELGIIVIVNTAGGGAAAADVLWQPKSIVVL